MLTGWRAPTSIDADGRGENTLEAGVDLLSLFHSGRLRDGTKATSGAFEGRSILELRVGRSSGLLPGLPFPLIEEV
jgi:hypothetical protein